MLTQLKGSNLCKAYFKDYFKPTSKHERPFLLFSLSNYIKTNNET